jgi:hypothetical protein
MPKIVTVITAYGLDNEILIPVCTLDISLKVKHSKCYADFGYSEILGELLVSAQYWRSISVAVIFRRSHIKILDQELASWMKIFHTLKNARISPTKISKPFNYFPLSHGDILSALLSELLYDWKLLELLIISNGDNLTS